MSEHPAYPIEEALKAQASLRKAAGLPPEQFPLEAFVGMVSDEIESLRKSGQTDEAIASIIRQNSAIEITAAEIDQYYAPPELRHQHEEPSPDASPRSA